MFNVLYVRASHSVVAKKHVYMCMFSDNAIPLHSNIIFLFCQGEQGRPGLGLPGLKGERVITRHMLCSLHPSPSFSCILNFPTPLLLPRASVVCASQQRLVVDLPASKCLRELKASQENKALQVHPDLQVSELMANRWDWSVIKRWPVQEYLEAKSNWI